MRPYWLFLQIKVQLQKFLYILKWTLLTLTFWLVFIVLFVYILPNTPLWYFLFLLIGVTAAWILFFRERRPKLWFFLSMFLLVLSTWGLLHINPVQNWLVKKVTRTLSRNLNTTVSIGHIDLSFFNKMSIQKLMIADKRK